MADPLGDSLKNGLLVLGDQPLGSAVPMGGAASGVGGGSSVSQRRSVSATGRTGVASPAGQRKRGGPTFRRQLE